jgi:hypothetical protein
MGHRQGVVKETRATQSDLPRPSRNREGIGIQDLKHAVKSGIKSVSNAAL